MSRSVTFRGILLAIFVMACAGCARNYGADGATGDGPDGPNGETGEPAWEDEPRPPYLTSIEGIEFLHLDSSEPPTVFRLDDERWGIAKRDRLYVWNSNTNRLEKSIEILPYGQPQPPIWVAPSGDGVVLAGSRVIWVDIVNEQYFSFDFEEPENFKEMTARGFVTIDEFGAEFSITEHIVADGALRSETVDTVTGVRLDTFRRFGNVYTYRDASWGVVVQYLDDDSTPVVVIENGSAQKTFADGRYLYVESSTPRLIDTERGELVDLPPDWRWETFANQGSDETWVILSDGPDRRAFWTVGEEPIEVPVGEGLRYFDKPGIERGVGWVYIHYETRIDMVLYAFESGQFWTVDITELGFHEAPAVNLDDAGQPVVVWPTRLSDGPETAVYWRPQLTGLEPLPGTNQQLRSFWSTRDPTRFVGIDFSNRFSVADLERERLIEAGESSPCGRNAVASDGGLIGTSIGRDFSVFNVDTLTSKIIGRNVDFFGPGCRDSFTSSMSRGLFMSAFDGKIGDLTYWDGENVVKVLGNVPRADAELDPLSGTWSLVGETDALRYLAEFEAESRTLNILGEATASNLDRAWDRAGRNVVFLDTDEVNVSASDLNATIYVYRPMLGDSPTGLASGPFAAVWMLGDDVLAQNVGETRSIVIIADDGPIDPGAVEDELWEEPGEVSGEDVREEPRK